MNTNEIIAVIKDISTILNPVSSIVAAIIGVIYAKNNFNSQEFAKLKSGQINEVVTDLLNSGAMSHYEFHKTKNFLDIAKKADEYYKQNPKTIDTNKFDFDWYMRFYESVGNISDEQMKDIWARILTQEIKEPNTISYKTIDALKSMRKQDAELFAKICRYSIRSSSTATFIPNYDKYMKDENILYGEIVSLSEYGLISDNSLRTITMNYNDNDILSLYTNDKVMIIKRLNNNVSKQIIKVYNFTKIGTELSRVVDDFGKDVIWNDIKTDILQAGINPNIVISLHLINYFEENGSINHQTENII